MDPHRYKSSSLKDRPSYSPSRSPSNSGFDDTTTSIKESSINKLNAMKFPSEPQSPSEDIVINFQTDNLSAGDDRVLSRSTTAEGHLLSRVTTMGQGQGERLLTPADEIMPSNLLEEETILRLVSNSVFYILRINAMSLVLFGILMLVITWDTSYLYAVGFLWAIDSFELLQMLIHSRRYRATVKSKVKKLWACLNPIIKTLASAGTKGLLVLYHRSKCVPLVACVLPIAVYELCSSLSAISKSTQKTMKKMNLGIFCMKALLASSAIAAALKFEGKITWDWKEAIIGYWMCFALLCGVTLVAVLCLVNRCCVFFFADSDQFQVCGVVWSVLILAGKGILSCLLILSLLDSYENNFSTDNLINPFLFIMGYNLIMLLYTLGYYTEIENFFRNMAAIEDEYEHTQTFETETKENQPKTLEKLIVPKFLTKSSSTYYRVVTDSEVQEAKQKRKKKLQKKREKEEKERAKQKQVEREPPKRPPNRFSKDYAKMGADRPEMPNFKSTKNDMLNTIAETEQDKRTHITEFDRKAALVANSKRRDIGRDFFASLSNKTGVLGIVPSVVKRLGFKSKKGYKEQEDPEEDSSGNQGPTFNQSCDFTAGRSAGKMGAAMNVKLQKKGRNQLGTKGLEALEEKLKEIDLSHSLEGKHAKERMTQSMYGKHDAANFSAVFDQGASNDSSMVEDQTKPKSGENSMTQQCLICFDKPPDAVFMNCGHGGVCYECSVEIWKSTEECYLCRNKIAQVLQVDLKSKLDGNVIKVLSSTQMINWEDNLAE